MVYNDSLQHHGIMGQKWGVRRFQNADHFVESQYTQNSENELKHFGIRGMKWYQRRWQNSDGSLTPAGRKHYGVGKRRESSYQEKTFNKGQKFYRVSGGNEKLSSGRGVYVVSTDDDRTNIKSISGWLANKRGVKSTDLYEHEYEANEDVKVASLSALKDAQNKVLRDHPEFARSAAYHIKHEQNESEQSFGDGYALFPDEKEDEKSFTKRLTKYYKDKCGFDKDHAESFAEDEAHELFTTRSEIESAIKAIGDKKIDEVDIPDYIKGAASRAIDNEVAASQQYQKLVMQELSKSGFNAMYDNNMNNAGRSDRAEADEALILFDKKLISEVSKYQLSDAEINDAMAKAEIWRKNHSVEL